MNSFLRTVETHEGVFTLSFRKIESLSIQKYFVVSYRDGAPVAAFDMKLNREGDWKVVEPVPGCIAGAEPLLAAFIEDAERQKPPKKKTL